jgi:hypothetical protein
VKGKGNVKGAVVAYGESELGGGKTGVDVAALDLLLEGLQVEGRGAQALHERGNRQAVLDVARTPYVW